MTSTKGTTALHACAGAPVVFAACLLNLRATVDALSTTAHAHLLLVCSGTFVEAAFEDVLAAGAVCAEVWELYGAGASDGAIIARQVYELHKRDLEDAIGSGRNGRRLLSRPELADDVRFCARVDSVKTVVRLVGGELKAEKPDSGS